MEARKKRKKQASKEGRKARKGQLQALAGVEGRKKDDCNTKYMGKKEPINNRYLWPSAEKTHICKKKDQFRE